jgi:cell division protein FtsI (penicillin-binding protein 3)
VIPKGSLKKTTGWRFYVVWMLLGLVALALVARAVQLTVIQRSFLLQQGDARSIRTIEIPAMRGMITDRNGTPLAITTPVMSLWVNPQVFDSSEPNLQKIAKVIRERTITLRHHLDGNQDKEFVYLKRQLAPEVAAKVAALKIPGLYFQQEYRRYYPEGETLSQFLGFTNVDDRGQEGIELEFNDLLAGMPGKERVVKDRLGHVVEILDLIKTGQPGHKLELSVDHRIQFLAYGALKQAVIDNKAQSGSVVVLNVHTGEVLAMANYPAYNPNLRPKREGDEYRNRAVTDVFEPGSTIKSFSVLNALNSHLYTPSSIISTSPGWMVLNGKMVRDEHGDHGDMDVTTILQRSSNMGVTRLTLTLPPDSLWQLLNSVGFGQRTESGFPGEVSGSLPHPRKWADIVLATLSFGYGMSTTTLQLASAYATLAADGNKRPVTLLKQYRPVPGQPVLDAQMTREVLTMLESVVLKGGTARQANIPGYLVSGKTGTARLIGENGYEKNHHIALFVGAAPSTHPELVVAVDITDPQMDVYMGGDVSGPVFKTVMSGALRLLGVSPDDISHAS